MVVPWCATGCRAESTMAASATSRTFLNRSRVMRSLRSPARRLPGSGRVTDDAIEFVLVGWRAQVFEQRRPPGRLDEVLRQQVHPLYFRDPGLRVELRIGHRHLQFD